MFVLFVVFLSYSLIASSVIIKEHTLLYCVAFGSHYLQATVRAMVAGISKEDFQPYRRNILLAWLLMAVNGASLVACGKPLINELLMISLIAVSGWACFVHQVYHTLADFKRILNIEIYRIKWRQV